VGVCWYRTDSGGKWALGLGPPRSARHRRSGDCPSVRTVEADFIGIAHPTGWLGGFPTGRPWDFAFPNPIPRIRRAWLWVTPERTRFGFDASGVGGLSPRGPKSATCGDVNPTCRAAFYSPMSCGWPRGSGDFHRRSRAPRGAVAGRRLPPSPPFLASDGLSIPLGAGLDCKAFSTFAGRFPVRRREELYDELSKSVCDFVKEFPSYPPSFASDDGDER
jgi:hypothetical protein